METCGRRLHGGDGTGRDLVPGTSGCVAPPGEACNHPRKDRRSRAMTHVRGPRGPRSAVIAGYILRVECTPEGVALRPERACVSPFGQLKRRWRWQTPGSTLRVWMPQHRRDPGPLKNDCQQSQGSPEHPPTKLPDYNRPDVFPIPSASTSTPRISRQGDDASSCTTGHLGDANGCRRREGRNARLGQGQQASRCLPGIETVVGFGRGGCNGLVEWSDAAIPGQLETLLETVQNDGAGGTATSTRAELRTSRTMLAFVMSSRTGQDPPTLCLPGCGGAPHFTVIGPFA